MLARQRLAHPDGERVSNAAIAFSTLSARSPRMRVT
jgi:hypothetical protein